MTPAFTNSAGRASSPVLRIGGGVCSLVPRRHQNSAWHSPNDRGDCSPGTSLNLPGGLRRPAFSPLSGGVTFFACPCQFRLVRLGSDPSHHPSAVTHSRRGGRGFRCLQRLTMRREPGATGRETEPALQFAAPGDETPRHLSPLSGGQRPHKTDRAHGPQRLTGNARGGAGFPNAEPVANAEPRWRGSLASRVIAGENPRGPASGIVPVPMTVAFDPSGVVPDRRGCGPVQLAEPPRAALVNPQTAAPETECATFQTQGAAA
jgi:hypothetical protein